MEAHRKHQKILHVDGLGGGGGNSQGDPIMARALGQRDEFALRYSRARRRWPLDQLLRSSHRGRRSSSKIAQSVGAAAAGGGGRRER
jgi:hypothetical protein